MSTTEPAPVPALVSDHAQASGLLAGLRLVGLLTLLSRILGLVRDMAMAAVFGNGAVMDAFSVAFRIPNLARRLFGEGALTAAFLPAFVRELEHSGRESAWQLAGAVLTVLAVALSALVLVGEAALGLVVWLAQPGPEGRLLVGLTAVMLPYLLLICLASQVGAVLHALNHFAWPALLPVLLNAVWIGVLWFATETIASPVAQVYTVAAGVAAAGLLQLLAPLPTLLRLGFRFRGAWRDAWPRVAPIARGMVPVLVGLSITQFNTLADGLIAWGFSAPEVVEDRGSRSEDRNSRPSTVDPRLSTATHHSPRTAHHYPLPAGTASALYFGQRLYQFPLGVFGVALGTVMFPLLARHAEAGRFDRLRDDLTLGLRLVTAIGLPAGIGLWLLARPLTVLFFQRGAFDASDTAQTAGIIGAYSLGVWAYCAQLILHRAFYALNDRMTPLHVGIVAVVLNLVLNLILIWPLAGEGLALATSLAAFAQVALLVWALERRRPCVDWRPLGLTAVRAAFASAVMAAACLAAHSWEFSTAWANVAAPLAASLAAFLAAARVAGLDEVWMLVRRGNNTPRG